MNHRISIKKGLAACFKQRSGPSRPGVDWLVKIEGPWNGVVVVRTYLSSENATEEETARMAQKAVELITKKLESGWDPATGTDTLEVADT